jgi:hypothetical protein
MKTWMCTHDAVATKEEEDIHMAGYLGELNDFRIVRDRSTFARSRER